MSLTDFDRAPRMKDYLKPEDLNTEACVTLAAVVLKDAADAYVHARRAVRMDPGNKDAIAHLRECRAFYKSDYFIALSCGSADGEAVMEQLDKLAGG